MTDEKKLAKISRFAEIIETIRRVSVLGPTPARFPAAICGRQGRAKETNKR